MIFRQLENRHVGTNSPQSKESCCNMPVTIAKTDVSRTEQNNITANARFIGEGNIVRDIREALLGKCFDILNTTSVLS